MQDFFQVMEHFRAAAQCLTKVLAAHRDDHDFLNVCSAGSVRPAVDDVHHRHRHFHACSTAKITVQRQTGFLRSGLGDSYGYGQNRVCAETGFIFGAVQINHGLVNKSLLRRIQTDDGFGDFGVHIFYRPQHTLSEIALLVIIAQLNSLPGAGRGAGRHSGTAHYAGFQQHIGLDRGIATGVQYFTRHNINNCTHDIFP